MKTVYSNFDMPQKDIFCVCIYKETNSFGDANFIKRVELQDGTVLHTEHLAHEGDHESCFKYLIQSLGVK